VRARSGGLSLASWSGGRFRGSRAAGPAH